MRLNVKKFVVKKSKLANSLKSVSFSPQVVQVLRVLGVHIYVLVHLYNIINISTLDIGYRYYPRRCRIGTHIYHLPVSHTG